MSGVLFLPAMSASQHQYRKVGMYSAATFANTAGNSAALALLRDREDEVTTPGDLAKRKASGRPAGSGCYDSNMSCFSWQFRR